MPLDVLQVQPVTAADRAWVREFVAARWGSPAIVVHEATYEPHLLDGFLALREEVRVGLITFAVTEEQCEIVTLDSIEPGQGVGSALLQAVIDVARERRYRRVWLVTTNDNLDALRFYQKRGFRLVGVSRDAVTRARERKPEIPWTGDHGIPIRDELELELPLAD